MKRMDADIRIKVFERDGYTCRYCGNTNGPFHADHVYPFVKGGETSMGNLVTACQRCNVKKGSKVGIYPKPIGYFTNKDKIVRHVIFNIRQEASVIFINLLLSAMYTIISSLFSNIDGLWIVKASSWLWLAASIYAAIRWIVVFFKTSVNVSAQKASE